MYTTPRDLMDRFDAVELVQAAAPETGAMPSGDLLRLLILGEETTGADPAQLQSAEIALERIEEAIADAAQEVDGYIGRVYTLPLPTVPSLLRRLTANIARYHLHDDDAGTEVRRRYEDALRMLKAIAARELSLGVDDPSPASQAQPLGTRSRRDRVFTHDTLADY